MPYSLVWLKTKAYKYTFKIISQLFFITYWSKIATITTIKNLTSSATYLFLDMRTHARIPPTKPTIKSSFSCVITLPTKQFFSQYLYILYTLQFVSFLLQVDINITNKYYRSTLMKSSLLSHFLPANAHTQQETTWKRAKLTKISWEHISNYMKSKNLWDWLCLQTSQVLVTCINKLNIKFNG